MKHKIILWLGAFIITFLAGYLRNSTSENYPVSGTIGVDGRKVSYILDKTYSAKDNYKIIIRTDVNDLSGVVQWRKPGTLSWNNIVLKNGKDILTAELPRFFPLEKIEYRIKIDYKDKIYFLPNVKPVVLQFWGYIPKSISTLYYIILLSGILLSTRTGLEYFNENSRMRLFSIISITAFFLYTLGVSPIYNAFKYNIVNKRVPAIGEIFDIQSVFFLLLWIAGMWFAFKSINSKLLVLIVSFLVLLNFIFVRF